MILNHSLKAFYNIQVFSEGGLFLRETGFFQNILTEQLFENWVGGTSSGTDTLLSYCAGGSGTGVPLGTDSTITQVGNRFQKVVGADALETVTAASNVLTCTTAYISAVGLGVGGGTLSEIGLFSASTGGILSSRALIKDVTGTPTSITIASNEYVKVLYKIQVTVDQADKTGSFVYLSNTYNYTARPMAWNTGLSLAPKDTTNFWVWPKGAINDSANSYFGLDRAVAGDSNTLAAITGRPAYTSSSAAGSKSTSTYTASSKARKVEYIFGASEGNISGGIGGVMIDNSTIGQSGFQISFSPKIPKASPTTFKVGITHQFSR